MGVEYGSMGSSKERNDSEKHLGRLENEVRGLLLAGAAEEEVELTFSQLGADPGYLKLLTDKGSLKAPEGDFEITLVSGKRKRDTSFYTGGYLLAMKGASGETVCLVLGSVVDVDNRSARPLNVKKPVFLEVVPGGERFTAKIGERDWFRHLSTLETVMLGGGDLGNKVNEVIGEILLGDREEIRRYLLDESGPGLFRQGRGALSRDFAGTPRNREAVPRTTNVVIPVNPRIAQVRGLTGELAAALERGEGVKIEGFPGGFPARVRVLLRAGARELKELGIFLEKMTLGQTYEGKKERVFLATEGTREEGQLVVLVGEDLATGKLNLIIGIVYEKGEGRGGHTVSAMLNFGNNVPVVADGSVVEVSVTCEGAVARADYCAKTGRFNAYAGGGRKDRVGNLLHDYFPDDRDYTFAKAFRQVLEMTRKTYGRLGEG